MHVLEKINLLQQIVSAASVAIAHDAMPWPWMAKLYSIAKTCSNSSESAVHVELLLHAFPVPTKGWQLMPYALKMR